MVSPGAHCSTDQPASTLKLFGTRPWPFHSNPPVKCSCGSRKQGPSRYRYLPRSMKVGRYMGPNKHALAIRPALADLSECPWPRRGRRLARSPPWLPPQAFDRSYRCARIAQSQASTTIPPAAQADLHCAG
jgi:hypothetical protein